MSCISLFNAKAMPKFGVSFVTLFFISKTHVIKLKQEGQWNATIKGSNLSKREQKPLVTNMSRVKRKPSFAYAKTKTQISFAVTAKLISAFFLATQIVQSLFFLNPKFQASSHLL